MKIDKDFFTLSFKEQGKIVYSSTSSELIKLHELVQNYIDENGNNDKLQWLLDKTFEVSCLRHIEEENPGYSCVGFDTFDKVISLGMI